MMRTVEDTDSQSNQISHKSGIVRWSITSSIYLILMAASLFLSAGTLNWLPAWIYIATAAFIVILDALVLIPTSPDLLAERSRYQRGAKPWDEFLSRWMATLGPLTIWIVCGLDFRNAWSVTLPGWLVLLSFGFVMLGGLLALWAMAANRFFVGMVRIQRERGHYVVSSGPYQFVRHPGYLGSIFYLFFTPFALGSLWGGIPVAFTVGVILLRTYLEDRTLLDELDGYQEYASLVRYRIMPGLW